MNPMHSSFFTLLAVVAAVVFGGGIICTLVALARAPEGYEDETGFHHVRTAKGLLGTQARTPGVPAFAGRVGLPA